MSALKAEMFSLAESRKRSQKDLKCAKDWMLH